MSTRGWLKIIGPFVVIMLAVFIATVMVLIKTPPDKTPIDVKPLLVEAHPVTRTQTQFVVRSQGNVMPKNQTRLSTQVSGNVVQLAAEFEVGRLVPKGALLAVLEQEDYETELRLAEAELAQAQAALEEEIARGRVAETEWRSVNSVVPPQLGLRKPQLAMEQANVKAAKAKYDRAKRNLSRTKLRAPYNGIVVERTINLGQFVAAGAQVGILYSTDVAEIRLPIIESELPFVDLQSDGIQSTAITLKANAAGKMQQWSARLVRTEGIFDATSRVMYVVAQLDDPYNQKSKDDGHILRYGQFVEAEIISNDSQSLFVLPRHVLRLDNTVLTVTQDSKLHIQPVEVVRTTATHVFIKAGLVEGTQVVFSVVANPFEGMAVRQQAHNDAISNKKERLTAPISTDGAS
ncbi:efflux RND transporter periplasmic adaptor subunit [Alteromonas sp. 14N.309.X.WAT.G.H12]|uniref:efflux RND transporter periplasmic adaptor subunit n=1 Tax=Alteromonas sp. 14N.309.X.WAT.G.H12 TaxID=3120824 RepID=UPI002FD0B31F